MDGIELGLLLGTAVGNFVGTSEGIEVGLDSFRLLILPLASLISFVSPFRSLEVATIAPLLSSP